MKVLYDPKFYKQLFSRKQWLALGVCLLLLIGALSLWCLFWLRSSRYKGIINQTLQVDLENSPHEVKGLEAFILSYIEPRIRTALTDAHFHEKFSTAYEGLLNDIISASEELRLSRVLGVELRSNAEGLKADRIFLRDRDGTVRVTEDSETGMLFVPVTLLHSIFQIDEAQSRKQRPNEKVLAKDQTILIETPFSARDPGVKLPTEDADLVVSDNVMPNELYLVGRISQSLQRLAQAEVFKTENDGMLHYLSAKPAQVFFITYTGINKTFTFPPNFRPNRFPRTTFFPSRPYFWPTFQEGKVTQLKPGSSRSDRPGNYRAKNLPLPGSSRVEDFFFVSRPYLDLGGSGAVITLARGIEIDGITRAIVGIDIPFNPASETDHDLVRDMRNRISDLSGTIVEVACPAGDSGACTPGGDDQGTTLSGAQQELVREWNCEWEAQNNCKSNAKSGLTSHDRHVLLLAGIRQLRSLRPNDRNSDVHFSLPVRTRDGQKLNVLLAGIDVSRYTTATPTIIATVLLVLISGILFFLLVSALIMNIGYKTTLPTKEFVKIEEKKWCV